MERLSGDILVVGLGSSGEAAAAYCADARAAGDPVTVTVVDSAEGGRVAERAGRLRIRGVSVELGVDSVAGRYDLTIMSPGVPPHAPLFRAAVDSAGEIISEIEFAFRRSRAPWLAVTGTNGKTTVTALLGHLLVWGGVGARTVGNIGTPAIEVAAVVGPTGALVAEVSSFQLALTQQFHPRIAVLLNITPDHLDWHGGMAAYAADKARIFARLGPGDTAVIDSDDPGSAAHIEPVRARGVRVIEVSREKQSPGGAWIEADGMLVVDGSSGPVRLIDRGELQIQGDHNVSNALAASAAAFAFGVDPESVCGGLRSFAPIEHRLEPIGVVAGIEYFNDSKATNPDAVIKALTAFEGRDTVVLLGGRNKGNDFAALADALARSGARAVVFGEAAGKIGEALAARGVAFERSEELAEALRRAAVTASALQDAAVILSPACASFDQFADYGERGRAFKAAVAEMARAVG